MMEFKQRCSPYHCLWWLVFALFFPAPGCKSSPSEPPAGELVVKPYLQLGRGDVRLEASPSGAGKECRDEPVKSSPKPARQVQAKGTSLEILWGTTPNSGDGWMLQFRQKEESGWRTASTTGPVTVHPSPGHPFRLFTATLAGLEPDGEIIYRLIDKGGTELFGSRAKAPPSKSKGFRFAVMGDCAQDSHSQRKIAAGLYAANPDMVVIPGDIVYQHGRISEYLNHYFPVYNNDSASPGSGAPLLRSRLFVAAPGNHDVWNGSHGFASDLRTFPDGLAYYLLWSQPLNGPEKTPGAANTTPVMAVEPDRARFLAAAGAKFPVMANFSFDYGSSHWTILDADPYVDWTRPDWWSWLEQDLKSAGDASWRFVVFHQPAFSSGSYHHQEQQMRVIAPLLQRYKVDVIFTGHVHNYQRSHPFNFKIKPHPNGKIMQDGLVHGDFEIDTSFDGLKDTTPEAPIHIVSGAGGAHLTGKHESMMPQTWQPFTAKFIVEHSFTLCDVANDRLVLRQIGQDGRELDRLELSRQKAAAGAGSGSPASSGSAGSSSSGRPHPAVAPR